MFKYNKIYNTLLLSGKDFKENSSGQPILHDPQIIMKICVHRVYLETLYQLPTSN